MSLEIEEAKKYLKEWVAEGRSLKANYLIITLDKTTNKYYPFFSHEKNPDDAWSYFEGKPKSQPMISFNLNKKVLGVD